MVDPKISLTLTLPGRVKVSQLVTENNQEYIPAKQVIKMSREAYNNMLNESVSSKYKKTWRKLPAKERIFKHCELIAQALGATEFNYNILED